MIFFSHRWAFCLLLFLAALFFPIDELAHRVVSIHFLLLLPLTGINLMCSRDERLEPVCNDFFSPSLVLSLIAFRSLVHRL